MSDFTCDAILDGSLLIVRSHGYIDAQAGDQLLHAIQQGFTQGVTQVLLNLSDSPVINSPGVTRILEITEGIEERHGEMALVGLSTVAVRFFQMAGILDEAQACATEQEALAFFGR